MAMFDTVSRRHFIRDCGVGLGKIAAAGLLLADTPKARGPLAPRKPHFAPKVKRVVHLFMAGAPSHLDLFDPKPALAKLEVKPIPPSVIKGQRYAFIRADAAVMGPRFKFKKAGKCGADIAEVMPHLGNVADELCFLRAVKTDQFNH